MLSLPSKQQELSDLLNNPAILGAITPPTPRSSAPGIDLSRNFNSVPYNVTTMQEEASGIKEARLGMGQCY